MAQSQRDERHRWVVVAMLLAAGLVVAALTSPVAQAQIPQTKLEKPGTGHPTGYMGYSVAVDGETMIVGAPYTSPFGLTEAGVALVYVSDGMGGWDLQAELTASDPAELDQFGMSVSVSGDTALVGAWRDDVGVNNSGSAYVFTRSGGVWTQRAKLLGSDPALDGWFGDTVSVSGDTALVGAWHDSAGNSSGLAYVFTRSAGVWTQQQKLTASDAAAGDYFGTAISLSGDTAAIGAYRDDGVGIDSGSAYVFTRSGGVWTQQQKLTASDAAVADYFGYSIWVSGDTAVLGARADDDGGNGSGSAYVFTRSGDVWTEQQKLTASDPAAGDDFGFSISVSGDMAVVGADEDSDGWSDSGSAYVFTRSGGVWTQQAKLTASDAAERDHFGYSVAIDTGRVIVGSPYKDDPETNSGAAYVFEVGHTVVFETDGTPGAWIDGVAEQTVIHGSDSTPVEAKAPTGYPFVRWTKDGADYSTDNRLTVTNVTEDMTLIAVFTKFSAVKDWALYD